MTSFQTDIILRNTEAAYVMDEAATYTLTLNPFEEGSTADTIINVIMFICLPPICLRMLTPNQPLTIWRIILSDLCGFVYSMLMLNLYLNFRSFIGLFLLTCVMCAAPVILFDMYHRQLVIRIIRHILSLLDVICYEYIYKYIYQIIMDEPVPPNVYQLNFYYQNIYECHICWDPFCRLSHGDESVLQCGHRFHADCLREWELVQLYRDPYGGCKCPTCQQPYDYKREKWNYRYTITLN